MIREKFEETQELLQLILNKVAEKQFPSEDECYGIIDMLDGLTSTRAEGIRALQESGVDDVDYSYISSLEQLQAAQQAQAAQRHAMESIVRTFLSVSCIDDEHRDALTRFQTNLASLKEKDILSMGRHGELEPYRIFLSWIRNGRPEHDQEKTLIRVFGYQLAYALLDRKLCLPGETPSVSQASAPETASAPQEQNSAPVSLPAESAEVPSIPVPTEPAVSSQPPEETPGSPLPAVEPAPIPEPDAQSASEPAAAEPAPVPEPATQSAPQPTAVEPAPVPEPAAQSAPQPTAVEPAPVPEPTPQALPASTPEPVPASVSAASPEETPEEKPASSAVETEEQVDLLIPAESPESGESGEEPPAGQDTAVSPAQPSAAQAVSDGTPSEPAPAAQMQSAPLVVATPAASDFDSSTSRPYRDQLASLSELSYGILLLMTHLGTADDASITAFHPVLTPVSEPRTIEFLDRIQEELETLTDGNLLTRYTTQEGSSFYCLSSYTIRSLRFPTVVKELTRTSQINLGSNRVPLPADPDPAVLLQNRDHSRLIASYVIFLQYLLAGPKKLSRGLSPTILTTLRWNDGTFVIDVPTSERPISCRIRFDDSEAVPSAPVLYIAKDLPEISLRSNYTIYGFMPSCGMHILRGNTWYPIRRLQWAPMFGPLPWERGTLERTILNRLLGYESAPVPDPCVLTDPNIFKDQVSLPGFQVQFTGDAEDDTEEEDEGGTEPAGLTEDRRPDDEGPAPDAAETSSPESGPSPEAAPEPLPAPAPAPELPEDTAQPDQPAEAAAEAESETEAEVEVEDVSSDSPGEEDPDLLPNLSAQRCAELLLSQNEPVQLRQLMEFTVRLISEGSLAEAAAMAEILARAPEGSPSFSHFYQLFRQSIRMPGYLYSYSSSTINEQQAGIGEAYPRLQELEQTMVLSNLLWAMVFPSVPYDHKLYNSVTMASWGFSDPALEKLLSLLTGPLKDLSFQNDGLGFSPSILSNLAGGDRRSIQHQELQKSADVLRTTPTSSISLRGLETCLKHIVGPASPVGLIIAQIAAGQTLDTVKVEQTLLNLLGPEDIDINVRLEEFIDRSWNEIRASDSSIRVKRLENDTPARRVCKKAMTDRLDVIHQWIDLQRTEQNSNFSQYRDRYARLLSQVRTLLNTLSKAGRPDPSPYTEAGAVILRRTVRQMLRVLNGSSRSEYNNFYFPLCLTPHLILGESGENIIVPSLYHLEGLEPWTFLLRAVCEGCSTPDTILSQIENYESRKWYRNYGTATIIQVQRGSEVSDFSVGVQNAERAAQAEVDTFKSEARLNRAYGKIEEQTMQTVFTVLDEVQEIYFRTRNFASFSIFLSRLNELLERDIAAQTALYEEEYRSLAANEKYANLPMLRSIRKVLDNQNFTTADSYINQLQSGVTELPVSERALEKQEDYLSQFLSLEKGYYQECRTHDTDKPSSWGEHALNSLGSDYCHWASTSEKKKGLDWLESWPNRKNTRNTRVRIQDLLTGLGFHVRSVALSADTPLRSPAEVYTISADRTPSNLKDYPHPIFKFGSDLCDPIYVVFLPNCKGESALISLMSSDSAPNGPTIVLMDGALTSTARHTVAVTFKQNISRQYPFLVIDRVLLLYLTSLNEGDRMKALLRCTLPYTFDLLYSSGVGAIPDEMFIGRVREMNQLCSLQGPNLVYGGRQLGKTALLTRASKIIHDPANGDYSFLIDVKDAGVESMLEQINRNLSRLNLLTTPCPTIEDLCDSLQTIYEEKRIRRLCIFVDESDHLFREFQQSDYAVIRPFITLRDQTRHHVKFVFAGTHNIAAMDTAENSNSNLMHIKSSLCIGPMSVSDAIKLIRIPMSYLGFDIGDSQIELILSNTNNYPGLIQAFCRALVNSVCRDFTSYYAEVIPGKNPPYAITDEQMRAVFREQDIRKEIGTRVMSTIKLNPYYRVISYTIAQMTYEDQEKGTSRLFGYSPAALREFNRQQLDNPILNTMTESNLSVLMDEMVRMNILWKNDETGEYRFQQRDFLSYIGTSDQVLEFLLSGNEEADSNDG